MYSVSELFFVLFFYINTYSLTFIDIEIVKNNHGFLCFQKVFVNLLVSIWDFEDSLRMK